MMRSRGPSILLLIVIFQLFFDVQGYGWICWWRFNCRSTFNANALQRELNEKLYGQPFVISTVVQALSAHYSSGARPKRALSLSFHGPSGTGKNFVSTIVANNVLCRGIEDTRYTYKIWLGQNFASPSQVQRNKDHIKNFIEERVAQCKYQIFIFDEVDKYHPGVLDVLKQYMEGFVVNDLDFNYAVFIFLTNAGGNEIEKLASEKHKAGITRDKLKVSDFMPLIKNSVYKDTSGTLGEMCNIGEID
ncbi:hypothetical protein WR25_16350 isoform B [Diploscapter pachys]|uniref:AAA+ ATPase domain-containing protein n=1 Tax=Diploscapter pachys TaxID=2018661 RepID=A0A2A2LAP9_9BILA|nr:hypothetical protein WR25_16350 isoform B [Diploscapter pachys]